MADTFYAQTGKRWFDLVCSLFALLVLLPFLVGIAVFVWLCNGRPVFFRQVRIGRDGRSFRIWKFRTMTGEPRGGDSLLTAAGDSRVTPLGRWLRKTKCDELPQLLNVLQGEMSLVGPRPEVPRYTDKYTRDQRQVLSVRPGVTGPTVNLYIAEEELLADQPDKESFYLNVILPAKLESDLQYCRNIAFNTDLKLIANTVSNILVKCAFDRKLISNAPPGGASVLEGDADGP
jgi:lipopolysaccharide/colanic/teichoic acid biosynthesis glycosyltransferase